MTETPALAIILAAGKGTRMKSSCPRCCTGSPARACSPTCSRWQGRPASSRTCRSCRARHGRGRRHRARARSEARTLRPGRAARNRRCGQGRAAGLRGHSRARSSMLYGDTPLLARGDARHAVRAELRGGADLVVIGFEAENPTGYGRLLLDENAAGSPASARRRTQARRSARSRSAIPASWVSVRARRCSACSDRIGNDNAKKEFYLTDAVALARGDRLEARMVKSDSRRGARRELAQPSSPRPKP